MSEKQRASVKRVTLDDVAKACGVSKMTVSRVVANASKVGDSTRKRVQQAIKDLGYQSDPMLRRLAAYRSDIRTSDPAQYRATLAYLDCDRDNYSLFMHQESVVAAAALGYKLDYHALPHSEDKQRRLSHRLWMQGIRGLLFGPSGSQRDIRGFQLSLFSMVGIGAFHHAPAIDTVSMDYFQGLCLAADECHAQGARNIAFIVPEEQEARTGHRWLGAYLAYCHHHRLTPLIWKDGSNFSLDQFLAWVRRGKVEAIIGLQGIRLYQNHLPHVIFAALNNWQAISDNSYISLPQELLAREAINLLDHNLLRNRTGAPEWPRQINIEAKWLNEPQKERAAIASMP